jgi:nucleotide-binding universal stress UspA family protein
MSKNLYIVPYDFTPVTAKALDYALMLAGRVNTEIQLLHLADSKEKVMKKKKELDDFIATLNVPEGSAITCLVKVGSVFTDIGKIAKEQKAQLIVMGTHGISGLQKLFGSNAMKVITSAECAFIVVQKETEVKPLQSIVVPIDLTKESLQIVNIAGDIAGIFNAAVHVIAEKQTDPILNTRIQNRISIVKKQYEERNLEPKISLVKNRSFDKRILNFSKENAIDMIAFAYHTESLLPQFDTFAPNLITNKMKLPVMVINSKLASALYF